MAKHNFERMPRRNLRGGRAGGPRVPWFPILLSLILTMTGVVWVRSGYRVPAVTPALQTPVEGQPTVPVQLPTDDFSVGAVPERPLPPARPPGPGYDHLSAELLRPAGREVIFKIGNLDGLPVDERAPLAAHEFTVLSHEERTVTIRQGEAAACFPQRLLPKQRLVLHLPEYPRRDCLFRCAVVDLAKEPDLRRTGPLLAVTFNNDLIWRRTSPGSAFVLTALLPGPKFEAYRNTLVIENESDEPVAFDALWIELAAPAAEVLSCQVADWQTLPAPILRNFPGVRPPPGHEAADMGTALLRGPLTDTAYSRLLTAGWRSPQPLEAGVAGVWPFQTWETDVIRQERAALHFFEGALRHFFNDCNRLFLKDLTGIHGMFCPRTGRRYPRTYALGLFLELFNAAKPRRLWLNVVAESRQGPQLSRVYWLGTEAPGGFVRILVAASPFGSAAAKVRLTASLPWQGETLAMISTGVFPETEGLPMPTYRGYFAGGKRVDDLEKYDRYRVAMKRRIVLAPGADGRGLLDETFDCGDVLYIRLESTNAKPVLLPENRDETSFSGLPVLRGANAPAVVKEREKPFDRAWPLRMGNSPVQRFSGNYRISFREATKGTVAGVQQVVPVEDESMFVEISYPKDEPVRGEGFTFDRFGFRTGLENKQLSFWVRPHVTDRTVRNVTLGLMTDAFATQVVLEADAWQRVVWNATGLVSNWRRHLVLYADRTFPEYANGRKVTFEINGVALLEDWRKVSPYAIMRYLDRDAGEFALVLLGQPGAQAWHRIYFDQAVQVENAIRVQFPQEFSTMSSAYRQKPQIFEIRDLEFPRTASPELLAWLTPAERQLCADNSLTPLLIRATLRK